jgi:hypothetical protein
MGVQAARYLRRMDAWMHGLAELLTMAKRTRMLAVSVPTAMLARILWDLHLVQVRRWMNGAAAPSAAKGKAQLSRVYAALLGAATGKSRAVDKS